MLTSVTSRVLADIDGGGGQAEEEAERSDNLGSVHFDRGCLGWLLKVL